MKCQKCDGSGFIPCFSHVEGGRCFRCGGNGREPLGVAPKKTRKPAKRVKRAPKLPPLQASVVNVGRFCRVQATDGKNTFLHLAILNPPKAIGLAVKVNDASLPLSHFQTSPHWS